MAIAYTNQLDQTGNDAYLRAVRVALLNAAITNSGSSVASVKALVAAVLQNVDRYVQGAAQSAAAQLGGVNGQTTDAQIQTAINTLFPMMAG